MRKFEEVVEETTETTETPVEETPTSSDQLVQILVDMGLSAEQAEAVQSMAQDLVNSGSGEEQKVEASRLHRRGMSRRRGSNRTLFRDDRRNDQDEEIRELKRRLFRAKRTIRQLRDDRMGSRPGAERVQFNRSAAPAPASNLNAIAPSGSIKSRVFDMLKEQL